MRFRPRASREKIRKDRPIPATTRRERIAQEGSLPPGHGRHPARQSSTGRRSIARCEAADTSSSEFLEPSPANQDERTIPGVQASMAKAAQNEKSSRAEWRGCEFSSAAIRPDALQSLAGVSGGLCFAPKLPRMVFLDGRIPKVPARVPTVQLPATSRSFASARGP